MSLFAGLPSHGILSATKINSRKIRDMYKGGNLRSYRLALLGGLFKPRLLRGLMSGISLKDHSTRNRRSSSLLMFEPKPQ